MKLTHWLSSTIRSLRHTARHSRRPLRRGRSLGRTGIAGVTAAESLEHRVLLAADFGDAPDTSNGTAAGDYQTTDANSGPSHTIDVTQTTLFLGDSVDGDDGTLQNTAANADDVDAALPDDEDGVLSPFTDLIGTEGAAPTITLLATNTTGSDATLYGWIDYNQDGVFDNNTERADVAVPHDNTDERFTLTFPAIPDGSAGTTYARFRLSTDTVAAQHATGTASDGEVEDYRFSITTPSDGTADGALKIAHELNGGPALQNNNNFGSSVASVGDLNGDGVDDLAVGALTDDTGGTSRGAVHVLFLDTDGTVQSSTKIAHNTGGGPALGNGDHFGSSLASVGDLNGDGVNDLAVGAPGDDTGGSGRGAVHVLFLDTDGTVQSSTKIVHNTGGGPALKNGDLFGRSVASVGDLDGDGVTDLAVGATGDDTGISDSGAVYVLLLNLDGTVKESTKIGHQLNGGPTLARSDRFGDSVASVGDLDGDGVTDLAVGAYGDDTGGTSGGAVHVLFLDTDGTVQSSTKIAHNTGGGPALGNGNRFGDSVASVGDLDGDGVTDLAVGAVSDDTGGGGRGGVHVLFLDTDGTVKESKKIAHELNGGPALADGDAFGGSLASMGDQNGDGVAELAVGATSDETGGLRRGAVYILNVAPLGLDYGDAPDTGAGTGSGNYETTAADGGPSHQIVDGLLLGNSIDSAEDGTLQNAAADADDLDRAVPDDEDGVLNPLELRGTLGAAPSVTLLATNTTSVGAAAMLAGWIDYNNNGVFENSERATAPVPNGTTDGRVTLTFPAIPLGFTGRTYARFRLAFDQSFVDDSQPVGALSSGEVEDYVFTITAPSEGDVAQTVDINSSTTDGPTLDDEDGFGISVTSVGDLDGDGVNDLAVGAAGDDEGGDNRGAVHLLFLNANGTVRETATIDNGTTNVPRFSNGELFGSSVTSLGDLDGDGFPDLAAGAADGTSFDHLIRQYVTSGEVHVLFLNGDGTIRKSAEIDGELSVSDPNWPVLDEDDQFGISMTSLGDLDGDGVVELAVGAAGDDEGGADRGAVHVLFLDFEGAVRRTVEINSSTAAGLNLSDGDRFGASLAALGDLDGDGVTELAVGATGDDGRGAVHVLFLNDDGTVRDSARIENSMPNVPAIGLLDNFGTSLTPLGDLDGNGVADLAVGSVGEIGGSDRQTVDLLFLNADASVRRSVTINNSTPGGPALNAGDGFGRSVTSLGDLNGDGVIDLAVGADGNDTEGSNRGAVHILNLAPPPPPEVNLSVSAASGTEADQTAITVTVTADEAVDGDQSVDVAVIGRGVTSGDFTLEDDDMGTDGVQIRIPDGQTSGSITFTIQDDALAELDETATISISNPTSGISLGDTTSQAVTIVSDDVAPLTVNIDAASISENGGTSTATVSRQGTSGELVVNLASDDTGEASVPATVTIADGQTTSPEFTVTAVDDGVVDGTQTVTITASAAGFNAGSDTIDITDDEFQRRYDFGTASSPVAAGYTQVLTTSVFPGSPNVGDFGWASTSGLSDRDRTFVSSELNRDYVKSGAASSVFQVSLPNGDYRVTFTIGSGSDPRTGVGVALEGTLVSTINATAGTFVTETHAVTVADGVLSVDLQKNGPTATGVNVLEIVQATLEPVVTPTADTQYYDLGDPATPLDNAIAITDPDDTELTGAAVSITSGFESGSDVLDFTDQNNITGSFDPDSGVLTLSGTDTVENYQSALQSVTFRNTGGTPGTRTIEFAATDQVDTGFGIRALTVLSGGLLQHDFDFGNASSAVESGYTAVEIDDAFNPADGYGWLDDAYNNGLSDRDRTVPDDLRADYHKISSGSMTFGVDLPNGDYFVTAILGSNSDPRNGVGVFYEDTQVATVNTNRGAFHEVTERVTVSDGRLEVKVEKQGSTGVSINGLRILEATNAPDVTPSSAPLFYQTGSAATAIDDMLTVTDPDDANLTGATVSITDGYVQGDDVLAFTDQLGISGSYDGNTGVLTLSGTTTVDNYQTALRTVTYENTNGAAPVSTREITFAATDETGDTGSGTRDIGVQAPFPGNVSYDFGTQTSDVEAGFIGVNETTVFTAASGYGFLNTGGISSRNRNAPVPLDEKRDYVKSDSGSMTFAVTLPNGNYDVTFTIGSSENGRNGVGVLMEGDQVATVTTPQGIFAVETHTVTVSDNRLEVEIARQGGSAASINALVIDAVS